MGSPTPGPWQIVGVDGDFIAGPDGKTVAHSGWMAVAPEMCRANARLIAAAPDLLEAATVAIGELAFCEGALSAFSGNVPPSINAAIEACFAAIAKATGEAVPA